MRRPAPARPVAVLTLALTLSALAGAVPAAAAPVPLGAEIALEATSPYRSIDPRAAILAGGRSVVVWENQREGMWARFLDAAGQPEGAQRLLVPNGTLPPNPGRGWWTSNEGAALAPLPDGGFLLLWTRRLQYVRLAVFQQVVEPIASDVFARRFDAAGRPIGPVRQVNESTAGLQDDARAAVVGADRVLALWREDRRGGGIRARLLTRDGRMASREIGIGGPGAAWPAAAANAGGDVLVAWGDRDADEGGVLARLYDDALVPVGPAFAVHTTTSGRQATPAVAAGTDGGFLVTWRGPAGSKGTYRDFAQAVTAAGALAGGEKRIGPDRGNGDLAPAVLARPDGGYVALWMGWRGWYSDGIFARELDATGEPAGEALRVNQETVVAAHRFGVAADGGRLVVAWEGFEGDDRGIQARVLEVAPGP